MIENETRVFESELTGLFPLSPPPLHAVTISDAENIVRAIHCRFLKICFMKYSRKLLSGNVLRERIPVYRGHYCILLCLTAGIYLYEDATLHITNVIMRQYVHIADFCTHCTESACEHKHNFQNKHCADENAPDDCVGAAQ
jgi:hypothetical protein